MTLISQEHYDMMKFFEEKVYVHGRFDKEPKELWAKKIIYQDAVVNSAFLAFRHGVAYGKTL